MQVDLDGLERRNSSSSYRCVVFWRNPSAALWFWRNQSGDEVDLLVEMNGLLYAIECKMAERPSGHAVRGIRKLRDLYGEQSVPRAFIACSTESRYDIAPGVTAVNGWRTWDLDAAT